MVLHQFEKSEVSKWSFCCSANLEKLHKMLKLYRWHKVWYNLQIRVKEDHSHIIKILVVPKLNLVVLLELKFLILIYNYFYTYLTILLYMSRLEIKMIVPLYSEVLHIVRKFSSPNLNSLSSGCRCYQFARQVWTCYFICLYQFLQYMYINKTKYKWR